MSDITGVSSIINGVDKLLSTFSGLFKDVEDLEGTLTTSNSLLKHPLEGLTPAEVVQQAKVLGLKTPQDQFLLWSGLGKNGVELSQTYARANDGITLEMTSGGKWLDEMNLFGENSPFTPQEAMQIWTGTSKLAINQASGQVRAVLGQVSIYMTSELPEALANEQILGVDGLYLKPRFIFQ